MKSFEKKARIVWRTKSVEVTRVTPRRYATSVATVDFPVPVAPPTSRMIGRSRSDSRRYRRRRRVPRPLRLHPSRDQRAREQTLREREPVLAAERQRLAVAALGHATGSFAASTS